MKKLLLMLLACLIVTVGCGAKNRTYEEISFDQYKEMIDNKESFILFIGSKNCSHCTGFKKTINSVLADYDVDVYYIDIASFNSAEGNKFDSMVKFTSTPTTVFYTDGVEEHPSYNRIIGAKSYSEVVKMLKKNGYIKEE